MLGGPRPAGNAVWVTGGGGCPEYIPDDRVVVTADGWLKDAVIALTPIAGHPTASLSPAPGLPVAAPDNAEILALHCGLVPRVQVKRPGAALLVREEAGTGHRLHAYRDGNTLWDGTLAAGKLRVLASPGVIDVRCDTGHEWEVAWILVTSAPHFAVSGEDGRFRIEAVPRGRYDLRAWHPCLGSVEVPITVDPAAPSALVVSISGRGIIEAMYPGDTVEVR